jgi:hypothetical protein
VFPDNNRITLEVSNSKIARKISKYLEKNRIDKCKWNTENIFKNSRKRQERGGNNEKQQIENK